MELAEVQGLVGEVAGIDPGCRDRDVLAAGVAAVARLRSWLDGRDVTFAAGLGS